MPPLHAALSVSALYLTKPIERMHLPLSIAAGNETRRQTYTRQGTADWNFPCTAMDRLELTRLHAGERPWAGGYAQRSSGRWLSEHAAEDTGRAATQQRQRGHACRQEQPRMGTAAMR